MHHFNTRTVVLVGILAIVLPVISRITASPLALLILAPFVLFFFAISFFCLSVYLGHVLDTKAPLPSHNLYSVARPFSFSTPAAWQAVLTRSQWSQNAPQSLPPLYPDDPEISAILNEMIEMTIRDFLISWYEGLSASPSFPTAASTLLHTSLENIISRATEIDVSALIVKRIMPKVAAHIEQFRESEVALRGAELERRLTQSDELDLLLASRYATKGGGRLHPAIENLSTTFTKQTEEMHIRKLVSKALPQILPEKESKSKGLQIVVREIVTCSVLYPIVDMLTDPDFWNRSIDNIAGAAIHQQKLITKVRNILEAQSPRSLSRLSQTQHPSTPAERITVHTDARQFESFLRSISRTSSLLDARRLKNDIVGEIRRTRMLLANHEKEDWINGEKTEDVVAFLDRLYTAKRKVDERIVHLGGGNDSSFPTLQEPAPKSGSSLRDILRNPNSLSYFMEFMDRRNRSLPVQFWLTVESFKNPLESIDSDTSADEEETIQASTSVNVKEDISMIKDLYFSGITTHPALSSISSKHIQIIKEFVSDPDPPSAAQRRVRRSVLLAQLQVEREMEQDFEDFERSELWFRAINDTEIGTSQVAANPFGDMSPSDSPPSSGPGKDSKVDSSPILPIQRSSSSNSSRSVRTAPPMPSHVSSNIGVLMSPISESSAKSARAPLFNDMEDEIQRAEEQRMEAIHAALTDIMALEKDESPLGPSQLPRANSDQSNNTSKYVGRSRQSTYEGHGLFGDDPEDPEPEPEEQHDTQVSYHPAAPGDLQLTYEIARLGDKIVNLETQQSMLDSLIKKAELTGDVQELKLLKKSRAAMDREIREIEFQKTQYEQQEAANRLLSDRTKVAIVSSTQGDEGGKAVVRYLVEVQQLASDGSFSSGWIVARRYNEFFNMHNKLKERYLLVRQLDFPGKRLVTSLSGSFLDNRRVALEKYLQSLIAIPAVCESEELRSFLSRNSPFVASSNQVSPSKTATGFSGTNLVRNMYRSVTESIDDMFFGPSMLDVMIQRLTRQAAEFAGIVGSGVNDEDLVAQALNASGKATSEATLMRLSGDLRPLEGETSTSTFSAPICDLILAVFDLNKKNNWLRRQAIVIILQQVLGGTIERKFREYVKSFLQEGKLLSSLRLLQDSLWPGGKLKSAGIIRTAEEKIRTRDEANRKLSFLIPDLASNMIGRSNARRGARRIFAVLQNRRLNQHIVYTIIDEVFSAMFPEVNMIES